MKRFLTILSLVFLSLPVLAQRESSTTFGLDAQDAKAVRQIRYRMAKIRETRPTVALVLSGGGAKGAATVGALKYLEQYNFPIDMVVGTSVGGLLGGLYALGYDVDYLDTLIHSIDWDMALSDKVDRSYVPYSRIRYKEKFFLSFPFYYRAEDFPEHLKTRKPEEAVETQLNTVVRDNLLRSLPSGLVYGENVNHIISSRTAGYSDSTDFFSFPTPFACVATDIGSRKAKIWHSGSINEAMRSTMSIPGLFVPVRTRDMVLVDGGMRNNFPVNVARDMGADIVIGIDLSDASLTAESIHNLGDVIVSSIDLMSSDSFNANLKNVDIYIHPNLEGYNMLSFTSEAVDTMFVRGYEGAKQQEQSLKALRRRLGNAGMTRHAPPAVDIGLTPVKVSEIEVIGVSEREAQYIREKMKIRPGDVVSREKVEHEVASIFGKGAFNVVDYAFLGTEEPYKLQVQCQKGPLHQFGFGARIDNQDLVSLLVNIGLYTNAMSGSSLDMTARISTNPYLDVLYSYNAPQFSTMNLRSMVRYTNQNSFLANPVQDLAEESYSFSFVLATQEAFLSNMRWSDFDVKLGLRNQYLKLNRVLSSQDKQYDFADESGDYPSLFLDARIETMDNSYFPTKGVSAGLRGDLVSCMFTHRGDGAFGAVSGDVTAPIRIGEHFALLPQGYFRFLLHDENSVPLLFSNAVGGDLRGRYLEQQFPFVGVSEATVMNVFVTLLRMDARYQLYRNHYLSLMTNGIFDFKDFANYEEGTLHWGAGLGYSYNTVAGPFKVQLFWSSITRKVGGYLSFGFNF